MKAYAGAFGAKGRDEVELGADIVSAYVSNNPALPSEIPGILAAVHAALVGLRQDGTVRKLPLKNMASIEKTVYNTDNESAIRTAVRLHIRMVLSRSLSRLAGKNIARVEGPLHHLVVT
jgi:hypothetical protein